LVIETSLYYDVQSEKNMKLYKTSKLLISRPLKEVTASNVALINLNFNASSRLFREKLLALFSFVSTKEKVWQDFFFIQSQERYKRIRFRVFFFAIKSNVGF
jgi:hypothetical protein